MARHRTYPIAFKRQIAQEFLSGEVSLHGLAKRNDICRNLIRVWVEKWDCPVSCSSRHQLGVRGGRRAVYDPDC